MNAVPPRRPAAAGRSAARTCARAVLGALLVLPLLAGPAPAGAANRAARWAEGHILVQPRAGLPERDFSRILRQAGAGRAVRRLAGLEVRVVEVPARAEQAVARALSASPHIAFAEVDAELEPVETLPDDPEYPKAWHLPKIAAPLAWDLSLGDGVTLAVLDTGVDAFHLDLRDNLVAGRNVASGNADTTDIYGHGTKVAGAAAAVSNNALGVASVAWNARIMPVRITNNSSDGRASLSDIAAGIVWAADHGARVANVSYEANGSGTVDSAARYMRARGGLVVIAAGNTGSDPGYGADRDVLSISATNGSDTRTSWSSYGSYVDLAAPGVGIWTTTRGGGYGAPSGTSFSSPVVAGVIALVMSANPQLSPDEVEAVLFQSALDRGLAGWDPLYGWGRVDASAAVSLAASAPGEDTQPPAVTFLAPQANATVSGLVAVDVGASDNLGVARVELYAGSTLVGSDSTAPYGFSFDSTSAGDGGITLLARAYDAAGNRGEATLPIDVANGGDSGSADTTPPTVVLTSPADGSTVSGTVSLNAYATDDRQLAEVRISVDGRLKCAGSPSVSCGWNTRKESAGGHTVTATATDAAGNQAASSASVTVGANSKGGGGGGGGGGNGGGGGKGGGKGKGKP